MFNLIISKAWIYNYWNRREEAVMDGMGGVWNRFIDISVNCMCCFEVDEMWKQFNSFWWDPLFRQPRKHSLIKGGLNSCVQEPQNVIWYKFEKSPAILALWCVLQKSLDFEAGEEKLHAVFSVSNAFQHANAFSFNKYVWGLICAKYLIHILLIIIHLEYI